MASETLSDDDAGVVSDTTSDALAFERKALPASILLVVVGSVLPWASVFGQTVFGFEGDGIITLIIAVLAGGILYAGGWKKRGMLAIAALGGFISLIALLSVTGIAAIGVYLTLLAGLGMVSVSLNVFRTLP